MFQLAKDYVKFELGKPNQNSFVLLYKFELDTNSVPSWSMTSAKFTLDADSATIEFHRHVLSSNSVQTCRAKFELDSDYRYNFSGLRNFQKVKSNKCLHVTSKIIFVLVLYSIADH